MDIKNSEVINRTQSICPVCQIPVEAFYTEEQSRVYFVQNCPEHGEFKTLASEFAEDFRKWTANPVINIPPKQTITKGDPEDGSCPLHCGNCENHLQTACCVLIDVTERCNQHCPYCFALAGDEIDPNEPTLEEISKKYDWLLEQGEAGREFNIQLSGGEPTVRDDLPEIIKMVRDKGFRYVQINSNGRRLAEEDGYAQKLKEAGASVIFMQFDGTRDDIYMKMRGEPLFEKKVQAIRNCEKAGLAVTLVPTVVRGVNDRNLGEIMDFIVENVNVVKGVHFQPASFFGRYPEGDELEGRITMFGLLRELESQKPEIKVDDSLPVSTGHALCCFYSTYIKEPDGSVRCTLTQKQRREGVSCCDTQTADCCCAPQTAADELEIVKRDRDYVLDKWDISISGDCCCGQETASEIQGAVPKYNSSEEITDLDEFLSYYRKNTFTVTGMAFQDITNLDAERLKRCRVVQLTDDYRLVPFCAYNTIYRQTNKRGNKKWR